MLASGSVSGWRAQAVATLTRQALETGIDAYWADVAPGAQRATMNVQLLCLPVYAGTDVAGLAGAAWSALSSVCHVRAYDLSPTADELRRWVDDVETVVLSLGV
jgi:hypothetical protein